MHQDRVLAMIDLEKARREYMERRGELSLLRERYASQLQEFSDYLRQVNQGAPVGKEKPESSLAG